MKNKCVAVGVTGNYCWWDHHCDFTPEVLQPKCDSDTVLGCWTERDWDGGLQWQVVVSDGGIELVGVKL